MDDNPYYIDGDGRKHQLIEPEEEEEDTPVNKAGTISVSASEYVFEGSGWGHQLGMSQYGAYAMAEEGFTYDEIIEFYFPGTHVDDYED